MIFPFERDFLTPLVRTPERCRFAGISADLTYQASAGLREPRQFSLLIQLKPEALNSNNTTAIQ
jgi:hypothetical protein